MALVNAKRRWLIVVGLLIVMGVGIWSLITYWDWLRDGPSGAESGSTTVRNLSLVIGGVVAILLAVWRSRVAERQADAAQRQADTAQQDLLNERYQTGAEMLGGDRLAVRLGGIYALQRLCQEHPEQYHVQIMQMFCAFARNPTPDADQPEVGQRREARSDRRAISWADSQIALRAGREDPYFVRNFVIESALREDVQAIMTAIGSRSATARGLERDAGYRLDLDGADLSGASLHGSDLSGIRFDGADLRIVFFLGANLSGAHLNQADLSGAMFMGADVSGAELKDAILSGASFSWDALYREWEARGITRDQFDATLDSRGWSRVVRGLTQAQLDVSRARLENPPDLHGLVDPGTARQLVWRERP